MLCCSCHGWSGHRAPATPHAELVHGCHQPPHKCVPLKIPTDGSDSTATCKSKNALTRWRERFLEDGLEEVGGVCAGVCDLRFQRPAGRHQRLHPLHDGRLLGKGREGDQHVVNIRKIQSGLVATREAQKLSAWASVSCQGPMNPCR